MGGMSPIYIILAVIILLLCVGINVMILLQKKRVAGLGGVIQGMGAQGGTYWDKNKKRSKEGRLERYTKLSAAVMMIICLAMNIIH